MIIHCKSPRDRQEVTQGARFSRLVTRKEPDFRFRTHLVRPMPHPGPVNVRQPDIFHDLVSTGLSEPVLRIEREKPWDDMLEAVPQDRFLRPFIIEHQNIVEYRIVTVSPERLDTGTQIVLDNPSGHNGIERANCMQVVGRDIPSFE